MSQGWPHSWSLRKPPKLSDQHSPSPLSKYLNTVQVFKGFCPKYIDTVLCSIITLYPNYFHFIFQCILKHRKYYTVKVQKVLVCYHLCHDLNGPNINGTQALYTFISPIRSFHSLVGIQHTNTRPLCLMRQNIWTFFSKSVFPPQAIPFLIFKDT